jgi:glycine/D-amino acid oxidase-like deaminating enzyme
LPASKNHPVPPAKEFRPVPGLPAQRSLWEATSAPAPALLPLVGAHQAEVAIVGAGYTGLAAAIALAEAGVQVTVLEAEAPGAGASGRNGGQVIFGLRARVADCIAAYGPSAGPRLHALGAAAAERTFALIARLGIECDARQDGYLFAADSQAGLANARSRFEAWQKHGAPVRWLDRDAVEHATGSPAYLGGYVHEASGSVQPLAYARGLARAALAAGARLHAPSRVISIRPDGRDWVLATREGTLKARRVLLATTGLGGELWPGLAATMMLVWSHQVATIPLPEDQRVMQGVACASDTRRVLRYWRTDRDGRVVVGGKGTLRGPRGPGSFAVPRRMLARLYPHLADAAADFWWGGLVTVVPDRLPKLWRLAEGVWAPMFCNGKGVAWCSASGAELAALLSGAPAEDLALPPAVKLRPIPLHPLRQVYAAAGSLYLRARDALDRAPAAALSPARSRAATARH